MSRAGSIPLQYIVMLRDRDLSAHPEWADAVAQRREELVLDSFLASVVPRHAGWLRLKEAFSMNLGLPVNCGLEPGFVFPVWNADHTTILGLRDVNGDEWYPTTSEE